jgi:LuxR family maltose regulon positive regulatory protein
VGDVEVIMAHPKPRVEQGILALHGAEGEQLADNAPEPNLRATKRYLPRTRPDLVTRLRLHQRMDTGLNGALTLVCAPAGFGKSTLVAEWLRRTGRRAAWLSLDAADSDPAVFLRYLAAALQRLDAGAGTAMLSFLQSAQLPPLETVMTVLINDLADVTDDTVLPRPSSVATS